MAERKLIYADELDAELESAQKTLETNWEKQWKMNKGQVKGLAWARAILREEKSADVAAMLPKWISVEERLPERHQGVIVNCNDGFLTLMCYDGRDWQWNGKKDNSVTHWMPLPEPPEEVQK